jgi:phosphate starvation-inducible protein PhoH
MAQTHEFLENPDRPLTKRERRKIRRQSKQVTRPSLRLSIIKPLTPNQTIVFENFDTHNLLLHGIAGTGKSFISMYLSLDAVLNSERYRKLVIIRSAVPSRDVGFQPGNLKEKLRVYEDPYTRICAELFDDSTAYDLLKSKGLLEFTSTSYIRGITLDNCIVLIDEIQNMTGGELASLATRIGKNAKVIFSGDLRQTDLESRFESQRSGLPDFLKILARMKSVKSVEFDVEDIVRSGFVKEFIIAKDRYESAKLSRSDGTIRIEQSKVLPLPALGGTSPNI